jgi:uncharacterized protein YndB with AHSA1/START domain
MTEQASVAHATFTLERTYDAPPERVFRAFADPKIKARWFRGPEEWGPEQSELDFRVGGHEISRGGPAGGPVHLYQARYWDIVPNHRIIFSYDMHLDQTRISVSLVTVRLESAGAGTRLTFTEQGAFLDGFDDSKEREHGTGELLDALGAELARQEGE